VGTGPRNLGTDWTTGQIIGGVIDVQRYLGHARAHVLRSVSRRLEASAQERVNRESSDRSETSGGLRVTAVDVLTPTLGRKHPDATSAYPPPVAAEQVTTFQRRFPGKVLVEMGAPRLRPVRRHWRFCGACGVRLSAVAGVGDLAQ
jgi:hypothetical protein